MTRLPPLNALRTFVVAARACSFAKAAEELHVTPAAVSRGVKALEDSLGCELFHRSHRKVTLTAEGKHYLDQLGDVFEQITQATAHLTAGKRTHAPEKQRPIVVCAYPSFAMNWLIPRWYSFARTEPGFDLRVVTTHTHAVDFDSKKVDVAILSDQTDDEGCHYEELFVANLIPVCAPGYPVPALDAPEEVDWNDHLLQSETRPSDWLRWAERNRLSRIASARGRRFENSKIMYEAAVAGAGIAVGISELIQRELATGGLLSAFPRCKPAPCPFYLVQPLGVEAHPSFGVFREWLFRTVEVQVKRLDDLRVRPEKS